MWTSTSADKDLPDVTTLSVGLDLTGPPCCLVGALGCDRKAKNILGTNQSVVSITNFFLDPTEEQTAVAQCILQNKGMGGILSPLSNYGLVRHEESLYNPSFLTTHVLLLVSKLRQMSPFSYLPPSPTNLYSMGV